MIKARLWEKIEPMSTMICSKESVGLVLSLISNQCISHTVDVNMFSK